VKFELRMSHSLVLLCIDKLKGNFQLREEDTKGFWEGQIGIKQRKYVDIKVPFEDKLEIRDASIFSESSTSLADFLQLFKSVPAFVKYAQVHGQAKWDTLQKQFIEDYLNILELPLDSDLSSIVLQTKHVYFLIMARNSVI